VYDRGDSSMRRRRFAPVVAGAGLILLSVVAAQPARRGAAALREMADEYWSFLLRENPAIRLREGLAVESFPDLSRAGAQARAEFGRSLLARLDPIRDADLDHEELLTAGILRREARQLAEEPRFLDLAFPATPYTFQFTGVHPVFAAHAFSRPADAERYLSLLARYATLIRQIETRLRDQERRGIRMSREEIPLAAGAFAAAGREGEQSLFRVQPDRLAALAPADRETFARKLDEVLTSKVVPAVRSLTLYLTGDYRARAPEAVGLGQYPGGAEYYRVLVRRSTTLDVSPEEIHRIGLAAMERLTRELDDVRRQTGFAGTLAEFRTFLKTDPRFFAKTPEEVGERLMAAQNRIVPRIPEFFGRTPKAPFGVKRLERQLEGALTFGYYQTPTAREATGYYRYNGSNLSERTLLGAGSLIAHELVPGHHFQINLQRENAALPKFRRELFYNAFTEGWGDYASDLAGQMGMYADPYDRAGRLSMDLFLTSRLVVDTGMNALGWPRSKAIAYMRENTLQSDTEIATETLRYSCDLPAQALAYKMGMREFVELREKARQALGAKFDVRRFHDVVLGSGSLPLDLLAKHVDWWMVEEGRGR
jgi:uncharacterized protein (DUF885 family)